MLAESRQHGSIANCRWQTVPCRAAATGKVRSSRLELRVDSMSSVNQLAERSRHRDLSQRLRRVEDYRSGTSALHHAGTGIPECTACIEFVLALVASVTREAVA